MRTIKLNSNFLPFVDVSTYDGAFKIDAVFGYVFDDIMPLVSIKSIDNKRYGKEVAERYLEVMFDEFLGELTYIDGNYDTDTIVFTSPQYYNFTDDSFSVKLNVDVEALKNRIYELLDDFRDTCDEFLEDNWESRDGFISLMPQCVGSMFEILKSDSDDDLAKMLAFAINIEFLVCGYSDDFESYPYHWTAAEMITGNSCLYDFAEFEIDKHDNHTLVKQLNEIGFEAMFLKAIEQGHITPDMLGKLKICGTSGAMCETMGLKTLNPYGGCETPNSTDEMTLVTALWLMDVEKL